MEFIHLDEMIKNKKRITYKFTVSEGLKKYFNDYLYYVDYPDNIESVPDGIAVIPFMTNLLQIMWLTNSELVVPEVEQDFYKCIENIRNGFENMYPGVAFLGNLVVRNVVKYEANEKNGAALFYSGGLDSAVSLLRHIEEKPCLLSIWGSDVDCENKHGWEIVEKGIREIATQTGLDQATIRSSFRRFDNMQTLSDDFYEVLQTTWWYGIKHGLGILGHAAPYAWLHGIGRIYIASSNCPSDGKQRCASDPTIDNCVRFFGCQVIHDGYEMTRQEKTSYMVQKCAGNGGTPLHLHVCWKSETGDNCCECEKCYRTMVGLWIEGADPKDYGFSYDKKTFARIYQLVALRYEGLPGHTWNYMKEALEESKESLSQEVRKGLEWMLSFDFLNEENNICRKKYKATWKYKKIITKLCPHLYKLYIKVRGHRFE